MKFGTLMVIKAAVCLILGIPILIVPELFYSLFGVTLGPGGTITAREYGAALIGTLLITWIARNSHESEARRGIIVGLCIYDAIGFLIILGALVAGQMNPLGWLAVVIYLFFAVGYGYFWVKKPQP